MIDKDNSLTYSDVGVDVDIEAKAARILYEATKKTWINRRGRLGEVIVPFDDFSGIRYSKIEKLPEGTVTYGGSDGVATKVDFAERMERFETIGYDLLAMPCDDAVIRGGEPVHVKNVLTVNTLGQNEERLPYISALAEGLIEPAKEAGVAVINGEIAQHNDRMKPSEKFSMDWSADVTWYAHKSRLITGFKIVPGDYLIGLREKESLRCNGISLVRRILQNKFGEGWENVKIANRTLLEMAITPSTIYTGALVEMFGGWNLVRQAKADLHGAAHISGGGIPEKLGRVLRPTGLGADIVDSFDPPELMSLCQIWGGITDKECYRTWHMGQGMIVISPSFDEVIGVAERYGKEAKVIGQVSKRPGIRIKSKSVNHVDLTF